MLFMSSMRQRSSRKQGTDNFQDTLLSSSPSSSSSSSTNDDESDRRFFFFFSFARGTTIRTRLLFLTTIAVAIIAWLFIMAPTNEATKGAALRNNKHHVMPDNGRGGVALEVNHHENNDDGYYWIIKACPSRQHGKACPDTNDFPLHVQIWNTTTSSSQFLMPPVVWEPMDAHAVCGGGKAWRIPQPTSLTTTTTTTTNTAGRSTTYSFVVEMTWYKTACLHGHLIEPWHHRQTVTLNDKTTGTETTTTTAASLSFLHEPWKVHDQNLLFVQHAAWHVIKDNNNAAVAAQVPPPPSSSYEWTTLDRPTTMANKQLTTQKAAVWQQAIVVQPEPGYGKFGELSNYELLCFVGNQTMQDIRSSFLDLRGQLFKGQRPFKFHFYNIADLQQPDRYWTEEKKTGMRKCKHMLVNMEEFVQPLSQREYHTQIQNFVGHLLRVMKDETFPIRLLTWTESAVGTPHCHSPFLPWGNQHPCNAVLHNLFQQDPRVFPSRVKLLDNTDLTLPANVDGSGAGNEKTSMRAYLLAAIALRIYVIVGEQVAAWRQVGQIGKVDGLHRNGKVEPNFKLEPYLHWGEPL